MKNINVILLFLFTSFFITETNSQTEIQNEWRTHFEKSNFLETARYNESMSYFQKLADASPYAKMISFGISPQGRNLYCVVVSKDKAFNPEYAKKTGQTNNFN